MPARRPVRQILAALTLAAAPAAAFDCGDDPANLMSGVNCDFDTDVAGWTVLLGTVAHEALDGEPELGSMSTVAAPVAAAESTCFAALPSTPYGFGVRARLIAGEIGLCELNVFESAGGACLTPSFVGTTSFSGLAPGWQSLGGDLATDASTGSLFVRAECTGVGGPLTVLFDNFYLGENLEIPVEVLDFTVE
ncbi:MAG: hypothetical protein R2991_04640 [Thermoanaerobaculia bacterium]